MKQKQNINRYVFGIVALAILAGIVVTVSIIRTNTTKAVPSSKPHVAKAVSQFSFVATQGWWQGATNTTSMAVFSDTGNCFVSAEHKTGSIGTQRVKQQKIDASLASAGHVITPLPTQTLSITTNTGVRQYRLEQASVANPVGATSQNGSKVEGGQEFGYVPLSDNDYLVIKGYCDTSDQLASTLPALRAIRFDAVKQ